MYSIYVCVLVKLRFTEKLDDALSPVKTSAGVYYIWCITVKPFCGECFHIQEIEYGGTHTQHALLLLVGQRAPPPLSPVTIYFRTN